LRQDWGKREKVHHSPDLIKPVSIPECARGGGGVYSATKKTEGYASAEERKCINIEGAPV